MTTPGFREAFKLGTAFKFAVRAHTTGSRDLLHLFQGHWADFRFAGIHASFCDLARALRFWLQAAGRSCFHRRTMAVPT